MVISSIGSNSSKKLPAILLAGSLVILIAVVIFANPLTDIGSIFVFFCALTVLIINLLIILASKLGKENKLQRSKIVVVATLISLCLMFRSAHSLDFTGLMVLFLTGYGLVFYFGRR